MRMAVPDAESENAWIVRVKSEGAVLCLEPENCSNGWATPPGDMFMVRGANYLSGKQGQLPSKDNYSTIAYFVALEPIQDGSLLDQFIKGSDAFRNSRLKLIANIVKGPWMVRTAVGEQAICILGRALSCKYVVGLNYIEIDGDVGSSVVSNAIIHLASGYIMMTLTVDLAFLIESQTQAELPERILGAVRFSELKLDSAAYYKMPSKTVHQMCNRLCLRDCEKQLVMASPNCCTNEIRTAVPQHQNT